MFEALTAFLPELKECKYGEWIVDNENDGSPEHPVHFPYVVYGRTVDAFRDAVYQYFREHQDMEMTSYHEIITNAGLECSMDAFEKADVSTLNGQTIMAMFIAVFRAERFCEGVILSFFKEGHIQKWLLRLKEIDEHK